MARKKTDRPRKIHESGRSPSRRLRMTFSNRYAISEDSMGKACTLSKNEEEEGYLEMDIEDQEREINEEIILIPLTKPV